MVLSLSDDDVRKFQQDGYLFVRGVLRRELASALLASAKADAGMLESATPAYDASGRASLLSLRNEIGDDPYSAVAASDRVAGTAARLLGEAVYHYHHKVMLKEPRVGGSWEWHQDYGYWYNFGCLYPRMMSVFVALDPATRQNGCLQVLRGSHHMGRINHGALGDQGGADEDRVREAMARHELVYVEVEPGDAFFFHANLLHRSDANTSEQSRWSLICCYNAMSNDPYFDGPHPRATPLSLLDDAGLETRILSATPRVAPVQSAQLRL
jgi:hypothetical protein